jgi:hypothetical protein
MHHSSWASHHDAIKEAEAREQSAVPKDPKIETFFFNLRRLLLV